MAKEWTDDEVRKEIADAIQIVREDRFEAFVRSRTPPTNDPNSPPNSPPPSGGNNPDNGEQKKRKSLWWGDVE